MQVGTFITKLAKPFKNKSFASFWMSFIAGDDFPASCSDLFVLLHIEFFVVAGYVALSADREGAKS